MQYLKLIAQGVNIMLFSIVLNSSSKVQGPEQTTFIISILFLQILSVNLMCDFIQENQIKLMGRIIEKDESSLRGGLFLGSLLLLIITYLDM